MTILELRENRNKAWNAAEAFVETKRDKDGLLSEEDAKTYAEMEQKIKNYNAEIERMEQMERIENSLRLPTAEPLTSKPTNGIEKPKTGRASSAYKTAMLNALRTNFRQISDVLSEGVDANGGYLVPEEYDSRLIDTLTEENIIRKLGHTITTSGEHKINIAATKPAAAWIDEGAALTFGDATFAQINLDAHKLHVAVKVTEELLYDNAFGLENYIIDQFAKALSNAEEDAFLNGKAALGCGASVRRFWGSIADIVSAMARENLLEFLLKRAVVRSLLLRQVRLPLPLMKSSTLCMHSNVLTARTQSSL